MFPTSLSLINHLPMKKLFNKISNWYHALPDKKKYVEFISAALTIPMLLTVILINLNNIKNQSKTTTTATPTQTTTPIQIVITGIPTENKPETSITKTIPSPTITPSPTSTPATCIQEIGPIEILSPQESEIITTEKVCINVSLDSKYCPLVWSYQLDNDTWSDFSNNNICLYNLSNGKKQLQIKFKNTTTNKTLTLERNFTYQNSNVTPTPTITPTVSSTPTP